jgi:hypothetical protein
VRALIFGLHEEDPSLGVRRLAARVEAETGVRVSRETVRKVLRSAPASGPDRAAQVVDSAAGKPGWPIALSAVRPMTDEDHRRFDEYRGAVYETPGVWWTFP